MTASTPEPTEPPTPPPASAPASPVEPTPAKAADATPPPKTAPTQTARTAAAVTSKPATPAPRPATRPSIPPRPTGGNGGFVGGFAFVLAVCAMLVAGGAVVVAIYALDVARAAKSNAAIAMGERSTAVPTPSSPGSTASATRPAAASPTVSARPIYLIDTLQGELRLPEPEGCASVFVDIDAMRVGVDDGHEMYVTSCLGAPTFRIDRAAAVPVTTPVTTPEQCAELLAKETPGQESVVLARSGLVMCLLTSAPDAQRQLIPQRIGIVEVRSLNADGSISLVISTYRVPPS